MKKLFVKKKVSVYLRNHEEGPSCYYRIMQYVNQINEVDFKINDALCLTDFRKNMNAKTRWQKKMLQLFLFLKIITRRFVQIYCDLINKPDKIIIQREIFPRFMPKVCVIFLEKILSQSLVIWDFDDSIHLSGEISNREWKLLTEYSDIIVATSDYLLEGVTSLAMKLQMPTTDGFAELIDLDDCQKKRIENYEKTIKLVWVGTHSNLKNIVGILPRLNNAGACLKKHNKKVVLEVVCNMDAPELYNSFENMKVIFTTWTREDAQRAILDAHIGLMPLPDNEFSKGKGGFKLVQYMASGIPVIASDIGFNSEIVSGDFGFLIKNESDWENAVVYFASNLDWWVKAAFSARETYCDRFSYGKNLNRWKKMIFHPEEKSI